MEEKEAKLVYKNKVTRLIHLYSYIIADIMVMMSLFIVAVTLIVDGEREGAILVFSYVSLGLALAAVVNVATVTALMFAYSDNGYTIGRFHAIDIARMVLRGLLCLIGVAFIINGFVFEAAKANLSFNNLIKIYGIMLAAIEAVAFLYSLWKIAWIKENPERLYDAYVPAVKEKEEKKHSSTAKKTAPLKTIPKKKEPVILIEVKEAEPKEIDFKK